MGLVYVAPFENVAVSAAQDLFEIAMPEHKPIKLHSLFLYNVGADVGDAAEENLRLTIRYMSAATPGSGGSTASAYLLEVIGDRPGFASDSVVAVNNTTVATTAGESFVREVAGWNIRMPFERIWTPETQPTFAYDADNGSAGFCLVRLESTPADAISMSGQITFEELV